MGFGHCVLDLMEWKYPSSMWNASHPAMSVSKSGDDTSLRRLFAVAAGF
jgi:hypothetical protein